MKKSVNKYVIVLVVLFGLLLTAELGKPKPIDWSETYSRRDKIPYGAYIAFEELKKLNGGKQVTIKEQTPYLYLDETEEFMKGPSNLVIIQSGGEIDEYEWEKIKEYVQRGNNAFIASEYFNAIVLDSFGLKPVEHVKVFENDTLLKAHLVNPALTNKAQFANPYKNGYTYFDIKKADTSLTVLGVVNDTLPDFVQYAYGKGKIFLHANPKAYSNIDVLEGNNYQYTFSTLSYLPQLPLIWDEHFKRKNVYNSQETGTPLKFILQQPEFRWAYYTLLLGIGLFFIFRAKRRQRAIVVIKPLANTSMEFTETIGRLYFNRGNHHDIAIKKSQHFIQYVFSKYNLRFKEDEPDFAIYLSEKSGVDIKKVKYLYHIIINIRKRPTLSADELMDLSTRIDEFYKNAK